MAWLLDYFRRMMAAQEPPARARPTPRPPSRRRSSVYEEARKIPARNRAIAEAQAAALAARVEVQLPGGVRAWMSVEELARYEALRDLQQRDGG